MPIPNARQEFYSELFVDTQDALAAANWHLHFLGKDPAKRRENTKIIARAQINHQVYGPLLFVIICTTADDLFLKVVQKKNTKEKHQLFAGPISWLDPDRQEQFQQIMALISLRPPVTKVQLQAENASST